MKWLRAYYELIRALLAPRPVHDAGDLAHAAYRRLVARGLIGVLAIPVAVGGYFVWDAGKGILGRRRLEASVCMEMVSASVVAPYGALEPGGFAGEGNCMLEWRDDARAVVRARWARRSPWERSGERVVRRSAELEGVSEVEDGSGRRAWVVEDVHGGRLHIEASDDVDVDSLLADVVAQR